MLSSIEQFPRSLAVDDDEPIIEMSVKQALWADRAGYDAIFLPEHHFTGHCPMSSDSFQFAAYLAPQLTNAYLGFAVVVAPAHHPVRMVEQMNLLDQLTKGRVIFGVGSGGFAEEVIGLGVEMEDQVNHLLEQNLDIAMRLWNKAPGDPAVEFDNKYYRGNVLGRIVPTSYRRPHPLLAAVARREGGIQRAADNGWPAFVAATGGMDAVVQRLRTYQERLATAGHDEETLATCMSWTSVALLCVQISETDEQARKDLLVKLEGMQLSHDLHADIHQRASKIAGIDTAIRRPAFTSDEYIEKFAIFGSPDTVAKRLQPYLDYGVGNLILTFDNAPHSPQQLEVTEKSMRLYAEHIMPRLKEQPIPSHPLEALAKKVTIHS